MPRLQEAYEFVCHLKFSYLFELGIAFCSGSVTMFCVSFCSGSVTMAHGLKINIGIRHFCFKLHSLTPKRPGISS